NLGETSVSKYIVQRMTISQPPAGPAIRAPGVNGPLATAATQKRAFARGPSRGSPRPEPKVPTPVGTPRNRWYLPTYRRFHWLRLSGSVAAPELRSPERD